jgi:signal peptidase I
MEPTVPTGSLCLILRADFDSVEEGDIILFEHGGMQVLHRLIEKTDTYGVTQGDANNIDDGQTVSRELDNVYGKLVFHIPKVGYFVYSTWGKIFIVLAILFLLVLSFI